MIERKKITDAIATISDPELGMNLVDLGLIYGLEERDGEVTVTMTFTYPGCPYGPQLKGDVEKKVAAVPGVRKAAVALTFDPAWQKEMLAPDLLAEWRFFSRA